MAAKKLNEYEELVALGRIEKARQEREKQHEEDKKNRNFVQLYRDYITQIADLAAKNATALRVFLFFVKHMDGTNAICVSVDNLTTFLNLSRATVSRAIKYLKDEGWICILKSGKANIYIINPEVVWSSYDYQKKYCKFNATMLLSPYESEINDEFLNNKHAWNKFKTIDTDFMQGYIEKQTAFEEEAERINQEFNPETGEIYE